MKNFFLGKRNYIILTIAIALVVLGYILMSGGKTPDGVSFNPAIFSPLRIRVAPMISLIGFLLIFVGIMLPSKKKEEEKKELDK